MTIPSSSILRACLAVLVCTTASAAAHAGDWRRAHVHSISTRAGIDSSVNLECAPERPDQPGLKVMVVTYRVGKSLQWRAINLSADDVYAVGDEAIVNVTSCQVLRVAQPTDAPASAP